MIVSQLAPEQRTYGSSNIGNLAKDLEEEGVQNVTVKNTIFKGTQNGLRIKSWEGQATNLFRGDECSRYVRGSVLESFMRVLELRRVSRWEK
ncbi:unnamed protein product [Prunus armeniaca]